MPFYHKLGNLPHKRHTQFRKPDGALYHEELMGTRGFDGIQSVLYHLWPPTQLTNSEVLREEVIELSEDTRLEPKHVAAMEYSTSGDPITSRSWLFVNNDIHLGLATPTEEMNYYYRNGLCDEMYFVHEGSGKIRTQFGNITFRGGDYIIIPVGTTYVLECEGSCRFLTFESPGRIETPKRYRNEYGQHLEHSPFGERDFRLPETMETHEDKGEYEIHVKMGRTVNRLVLDHHPFDVVGWDGYLYPWIFNIEDFEPITGRVHMPPPTHQNFASRGYVVCSFVPRLYDYHPEAVPVPYNHSNVNSDEVLYYLDGNFMSRKGITEGSFTLHPAGIPHGPHPGTVENSLGEKSTEELAVMVDTFAPLRLTTAAASLCDPEYVRSWLEN